MAAASKLSFDAASTSSPFLALPAEIRIMIYNYTFAHHLPGAANLSLLQTCRHIYTEAYIDGWKATTFVVSVKGLYAKLEHLRTTAPQLHECLHSLNIALNYKGFTQECLHMVALYRSQIRHVGLSGVRWTSVLSQIFWLKLVTDPSCTIEKVSIIDEWTERRLSDLQFLMKNGWSMLTKGKVEFVGKRRLRILRGTGAERRSIEVELVESAAF